MNGPSKISISLDTEAPSNNTMTRRYPYSNLINANSTEEIDYYDDTKDTLEKNASKITKLQNLEIKYQSSNH